MIKSLFDEETTEKKKKRGRKTPGASVLFPEDEAPKDLATENNSADKVSEPEEIDANDSANSPQSGGKDGRLNVEGASARKKELERELAELEDFVKHENESVGADVSETVSDIKVSETDPVLDPLLEIDTLASEVPSIGYDDIDQKEANKEGPVVDLKEYTPEPAEESIRKSGLAYSAAVALFGSVFFMLIMGWFADLLLGIQPWGTVFGISVGALIGFWQLFRITSQIFKPQPSDFEKVSLKGPSDEYAVQSSSFRDETSSDLNGSDARKEAPEAGQALNSEAPAGDTHAEPEKHLETNDSEETEAQQKLDPETTLPTK
jgi:F0F1-type ATP synthase assembly protein I